MDIPLGTSAPQTRDREFTTSPVHFSSLDFTPFTLESFWLLHRLVLFWVLACAVPLSDSGDYTSYTHHLPSCEYGQGLAMHTFQSL